MNHVSTSALALQVLLALASGANSSEAPEPCSGLSALGRRTETLPFSIGERLGYRLSVGGAYVGRLETKVGAPRAHRGDRVIPIFARARTNAMVASFEPFSGRFMTMVEPSAFLPIGIQTEITYGDDPRWEKVRFSPDRQKVDIEYRAQGREHARTYQTDHAATDILALMFWSRLIRLSPGAATCQDVFSSRRLWRMTGTIGESVAIKTPVGKKRARRVDLHFIRKNTAGLSSRRRPEYDFEVYLAEDEWQTPLRFVFKLNGFSAEGTLEHWSLDGSNAAWSQL